MDQSDQPSESTIESWIAKYGQVYTHFLEPHVYWFRRLSRREYRLLLRMDEETEREEQLVETCLLWPTGWTVEAHLDDRAGNITQLAAEIMTASGCSDLKATSDGYHKRVATDIEMQMESTVDYVFGGGGNFARYHDWSYDQLFEAYARAEWVAVNLLGKKLEHQKQQQPQKPRKRGLADPTVYPELADAGGPKPDSIPDMDSSPMALRPMSEVRETAAVTARKSAMRQLWNKVPSGPART